MRVSIVWIRLPSRAWACFLLFLCLSPVSQRVLAENLAFQHVSVIPMDRERVLTDQTVLIAGSRIVEVASSDSIVIPTGARIIDGHGAFLIPGLSDMHVHFAIPALHADYDSLNRKWALELIANGVTTVRNMRGFPELLDVRREVEAGRLIGPRIFSTGPGNNSGGCAWPIDRRVNTPTDAQKAVSRDKADGFDAMKVFTGLSADAYRSLAAEARAAGLPLYGHVPDAVGLEGVLDEHQDSIEHLSGYLKAINSAECEAGQASLNGKSVSNSRSYNPARLRAIAQKTRDSRTWNCPTLVLLQAFGKQWKGLPCATAGLFVPSVWRSEKIRAAKLRNDPEDLPHFAITVIRMLHQAGARVVVGTDADGTYVAHGSSIYQELINLVSAGYSPFEALRASTADAAELLRKQREFGTVEAGKLADLILLRGNPLADIRNTERRIGVVVRGRWYSQQALEALVESCDAR
jgi:imidazolonepropionase-like amidohydrolase